ncbi:MAG: SURF1 family protein [Proteobacteria bacterium]|nr:SURF1 family protein [Pseudomonadota bacterium]
MTLVMLVILIGLGIWQVERLFWKEGILQAIDRAERSAPVPLVLGPTPFATDTVPANGPVMPSPFTKVAVTGRFRPDLAALFGAEVRPTPSGVQMGAQLIMPLVRDGAPPLLVDRGWVPLSRSQPIATPPGEVTVEGYVHPADHPGPFSARDDPAMRRFYTLDPGAIGNALGLKPVEPFTLIALGKQPPDLFPDPARRLPRPPNDHFSYAVTWFGLAVALVVIFGIWAGKTLRPQ